MVFPEGFSLCTSTKERSAFPYAPRTKKDLEKEPGYTRETKRLDFKYL